MKYSGMLVPVVENYTSHLGVKHSVLFSLRWVT